MVSESVFTAYLYSSHGNVSFFARKNFSFCGISTVVFCVTSTGGVFRLSVFGGERLLPAV